MTHRQTCTHIQKHKKSLRKNWNSTIFVFKKKKNWSFAMTFVEKAFSIRLNVPNYSPITSWFSRKIIPIKPVHTQSRSIMLFCSIEILYSSMSLLSLPLLLLIFPCHMLFSTHTAHVLCDRHYLLRGFIKCSWSWFFQIKFVKLLNC